MKSKVCVLRRYASSANSWRYAARSRESSSQSPRPWSSPMSSCGVLFLYSRNSVRFKSSAYASSTSAETLAAVNTQKVLPATFSPTRFARVSAPIAAAPPPSATNATRFRLSLSLSSLFPCFSASAISLFVAKIRYPSTRGPNARRAYPANFPPAWSSFARWVVAWAADCSSFASSFAGSADRMSRSARAVRNTSGSPTA